jgi:hypothetical protein
MDFMGWAMGAASLCCSLEDFCKFSRSPNGGRWQPSTLAHAVRPSNMQNLKDEADSSV